jgi:hypothetical protein
VERKRSRVDFFFDRIGPLPEKNPESTPVMNMKFISLVRQDFSNIFHSCFALVKILKTLSHSWNKFYIHQKAFISSILTNQGLRFIDWLFSVLHVRSPQEFFIHMETSPYRWRAAKLFWKTAPFSWLLRHTRGCEGSILNRILMG